MVSARRRERVGQAFSSKSVRVESAGGGGNNEGVVYIGQARVRRAGGRACVRSRILSRPPRLHLPSNCATISAYTARWIPNYYRAALLHINSGARARSPARALIQPFEQMLLNIVENTVTLMLIIKKYFLKNTAGFHGCNVKLSPQPVKKFLTLFILHKGISLTMLYEIIERNIATRCLLYADVRKLLFTVFFSIYLVLFCHNASLVVAISPLYPS